MLLETGRKNRKRKQIVCLSRKAYPQVILASLKQEIEDLIVITQYLIGMCAFATLSSLHQK